MCPLWPIANGNGNAEVSGWSNAASVDETASVATLSVEVFLEALSVDTPPMYFLQIHILNGVLKRVLLFA